MSWSCHGWRVGLWYHLSEFIILYWHMSLFTFFINVLCQILKYFQMCVVYFDFLLGLVHVGSQNLPTWQVSNVMQLSNPSR